MSYGGHVLRNAVCSFALNFTTLSVFHFYFECFSLYTLAPFFFMLSLSTLFISVTFLHYTSGSTHFFLSCLAYFLHPSPPCHSIPLSLTASSLLLLFSKHVMFFFSILSVHLLQQWRFSCLPLQVSICVISHPCFHHFSSFFHHSPLTIVWCSFSLHTSWYVPVLTGALEGQSLNECERHMNISYALFLFT